MLMRLGVPLASARSAPWRLRAGRSGPSSNRAAQDKQAQTQSLHSVRQLSLLRNTWA